MVAELKLCPGKISCRSETHRLANFPSGTTLRMAYELLYNQVEWRCLTPDPFCCTVELSPLL